MDKSQLKKAIADRKQESKAMHAEYVAKRDADKGAADYAFETMERLDREVEKMQEQLAEL